MIVAQFALFLLIGVGLYLFYQLHPPALPFDRPDRVFARFILQEMPVGVVGILLGAIFAAAMSTLSGSLNSCATAATRDLVLPLAKRAMSPQRELRLTRWLTALFGMLQIMVGIGGLWLKSSVVASVLGIAAFTTGIVLGVFFLGILAPPRRRAGGARRPGRRSRRDVRRVLRDAASVAVVRPGRLGAHLRLRFGRELPLATRAGAGAALLRVEQRRAARLAPRREVGGVGGDDRVGRHAGGEALGETRRADGRVNAAPCSAHPRSATRSPFAG